MSGVCDFPARRAVLLAGGALLAGGVSAVASDRAALVGVLMGVSESSAEGQARLGALREGLAAVGRVEPSVRLEVRWTSGHPERIDGYARELVGLAPDVIVANGTPAVVALRRITDRTPIVAAQVIDPVRLGLVRSLAKPGGNVTGFTFVDPGLLNKWRQLLIEAAPRVRRTVLLFDPRINPFYADFLKDPQLALGSPPIGPGAVTSPGALEAALAAAAQPGGSVMIGPDEFLLSRMAEVAQATARLRLPGVSVYRQFAERGGLMAYGPEVTDIFRRAAEYVHRILNGAQPSDLPVQQPVAFTFTVNHGAADRLGLRLPASLLAAADEVLE